MSTPHHSQQEPPTLGEHNGYPVYPMPAFVSLTATNLTATVKFFTEALDFGVMFSGPPIGGVPMLVHLRRARYQDILVRQGKGDRPSTALVVSFSAEDPATVDALAARVAAANGTIVSPPADTPWNTHDVTVADPDGHRFTFTAPTATVHARDFDRAVQDIAERLR